jgi:hypothetical protein
MHKSWSSSLCNILCPPLTSFLLCPNIFLNTLFSNNVSPCSYFGSFLLWPHHSSREGLRLDVRLVSRHVRGLG